MIPYYLKKKILSQLFVVEITSIDIAKKRLHQVPFERKYFEHI